MKKQDVLIIKTGYSETLDSQQDSEPSYGDVFRTTPLLHIYKNDNVTWVTDKKVFPLLEDNKSIKRLLSLDFATAMHLLDSEFDTLINLEKNPDICKLANMVSAWRKYGFRLDKKTGKADAYDRAFETLTVGFDNASKKKNRKTSQELLFEMVGEKWNGEEYVLDYKPKTKENYDIGLNTLVGSKWPTKAWPMENWDKLEEKLITEGFNVSRQDKQRPEILKDMKEYINWINSCKMIISNDSLGLHIGLALKKKVYGLFGSTSPTEIFFYDRGKPIVSEKLPECYPCFKAKCDLYDNSCMKLISPERVFKEIFG